VRVFLDAPHATDTFLLQRFESAKAAPEDPVNAGSAKHHFFVELVLEGFMQQHSCQAKLSGTHIELVRNGIYMRSGLRFNPESLILLSLFNGTG
jgi:hypothetical protein